MTYSYNQRKKNLKNRPRIVYPQKRSFMERAKDIFRIRHNCQNCLQSIMGKLPCTYKTFCHSYQKAEWERNKRVLLIGVYAAILYTIVYYI